MPKIKVLKPFKHSDDGLHVTEYEPGECDVSDRCAIVAVEQLEAAEILESSEEPEPKKAPAKKTAAK